MCRPQVKSPVAPSLPQVALTPVEEPVVVVSANEEKKPACTETGARSLESIDKKAPTVHVVPICLFCLYIISFDVPVSGRSIGEEGSAYRAICVDCTRPNVPGSQIVAALDGLLRLDYDAAFEASCSFARRLAIFAALDVRRANWT